MLLIFIKYCQISEIKFNQLHIFVDLKQYKIQNAAEAGPRMWRVHLRLQVLN